MEYPANASPSASLAVEIRGAGYPILCLHGHPGSAQSMAVFTDHLAQRFQTIAPDLRGYGKSPTRQSFQMTDHLTDLEALLDRLQTDRCLVLGWSLGGILAMELALRLPQRVSGLILVATAARPFGSHPPISWQDNLQTGIASIINRLRPGWRWNIDTFGRRSLYRYLLQQHQPHAYQRLANEGWSAYMQTSRAATEALNRSLKAGYNRLPEIAQLQCPCFVLAGEADRHITADSSLATAQNLPDCEWQLYRNTAHLFPWEISTEVLSDIDRWLTQHPQTIRSNPNPT